jgi:amino acid adenylation domain-containing protein/non-ribosomal peptide synthase protein (TIGR01720 family)
MKVLSLKKAKTEEFLNRFLNENQNTDSNTFFEGVHIKSESKTNSQIELDLDVNDVTRIQEICNGSDILMYNFYSCTLSILLQKYEETSIFISRLSQFEDYIENDHEFFVLRHQLDKNENFKGLFSTGKIALLESIENSFDLEIFKDSFLNFQDFKNKIPFGIAVNDTDSDILDIAGTLFVFDFKSNTPSLKIVCKGEMIDNDLLYLFADNFNKLLSEILQNLYEPINKLEFRGDKEQQLLNTINLPETDFSLDKNIIELLAEQCKNQAEKIAISCKEQHITYKELDKKTNKLARYIQNEFSAEKDDLFGIMLSRSINMVSGILSVWKTGSAYVPVAVNLGDDALQHIIENSNLKAVITDDSSVLEQLKRLPIDIPVIDLKAVEPVLKDLSDLPLNVTIGPEDLAYVIYTSGSTGRPKGAMIEHYGMLNHILSKVTEMNINKESVVAQNAPHTFDISVWQFFAPLAAGATSVVYDEETILEINEFVNSIAKDKVTLLELVPSYLLEILNYLENEDNEITLHLDTLILNAETLTKAMVKRWLDAYPQIPIVNTYGATEVSDDMSHFFMQEVPQSYSVPVMKQPIQNFEVHILDENRERVPVGVKGEIYLAGPCVGRGYFNDEKRTKEAFLNGPIEGITNQKRIYKTGDLARFMPNGTMEFIGRNDNQVKILGHRIELDAIENIMAEIPAVKSVKAIADTNKQMIVLYYVSDSEIDKNFMEEQLLNKLPKYMLPSAFIHMLSFPLTKNGKIDKTKLPTVSLDDLAAKDYAAPQNETQEKLAVIWQEVLKIDKVGIKDNFFDLGGHSLLAVRAINRIKKELGLNTSVKVFFENPTIESLSNQLKEEQYSPIEKAGLQSSYPLTTSQHRLWVLSQVEDASLAHNLSMPLQFKGELNAVKLEESFRFLINRHEALRTSFKFDENGELRQFITPIDELDFNLKYIDLSSSTEKETAIQAYLSKENAVAFDLEKAPLVRISLLKSEEKEYVFFMTMHHIISDGWSSVVLFKEMLTIYNSLVEEKEINLPELRIQYKDYANWLNQESQQEHYKKSETYWLDQFSGSLPVIELPGAKKRPIVKTYNGNYLNYQFSKEFTEKLNAFSQKQDATLFMTLMAGVNALLKRYTGQNDIIIGSPIAGRDHSDLENQIGLYLNTLALRTRIGEGFTFLDLLRHEKQLILDGYEHQKYAFDELVDKLEMKRDSSRSALFDIVVVLQNQSKLNNFENEKLSGIVIEDQKVTHTKAQFDLIFAFMETENLLLSIEYNTDIYDKLFIENLFIHFEKLLLLLIDKPENEIMAADYLSNKEKQQILVDFNDIEAGYPKEKTIVDLFEEQAAKTPDNTALVFENTKLTYSELNKQANQLGHYLREKYNIQPDDLLGIKLDRSEKLIVSILAVLKSGGAYVPIDPSYPESRKEYIEKDSNCKVIIDEAELEKFNSEKNKYSKANLDQYIKSNNLAYVIYTSGTTGNPKGSLLEHKNVVRLFFTDKPLFDFNEDDVWTMFHSYSFDFSVWEIYGALLYGGKLVVVSKELAQNTPGFVELIYNESVTILNQTPLAFYNFIDCEKVCPKRDLKLRYIIFGGEALNPAMLSSWHNKYPDAKLINMYGITETTVHVTYKEIGKKEIDLGQSNIGKPIPTLSCLILDEFKNIVPAGVIGEMYIGGSGLARGYLNRPELTAERFIVNPFNPEERLYKTGDLGRWQKDGNIEYIGRIDNQVKIRGHRIELGEIEAVLLGYSSDIRQFVVDTCELNGNKILVAYYVSDTEVDKASLRSYIQQQLPEYMVPNFFVAMDAIPLTGNGKVDRKLLPGVIESDLIKTEYTAPRNEEEKALVEVWTEVLKYEKIGVKDNFYNLGGDSIKSILIISKLKQRGYVLKIDNILRNPVLEDLARFVVTITNNIEQIETTGKVELTPIQHYFFETETIPNKNHYNQSVLLKSKEELEPSVLERSIASLVKHHDALRMVYKQTDTSWEQFNEDASDVHYKINFYDLREESDQLSALNKLGNELQSSFDISSGVLVHVGHFRMSDGDRLALIIQHLVVDGVSWRILLEDLSNLYDSYKSDSEVKLPAKTDSFQRWASLQKDFAKSREMQLQRKYWEEISKEQVPVLSTDYDQESETVSIDTKKGFVLDRLITEKLQTQVHNVYNTEINDILLTGLGQAIQEVFDVSKTAVKMEGHGREEIIDGVDIGRTVGWFTSVYPFVLNVSGNNALVSVKESLRKIPNKGIGYGILNYLDAPFESSLLPSVQFNYLGDFGSNSGESDNETIFEFAGESIGSSIDIKNSQSTILLDVSGMMVAGELNINIGYSAKKYSQETIDRLTDAYQNKLVKLITELSQTKESQLTPSDLTYSNLSYEELVQLNKDNNIEDVYELSPLQQGLYYHWLVDKTSPMYFEQMSYSLNAKGLSIESVRKAFNELISRYSVLRTAFVNNLAELPLQVVYKSAEGHFSHEKVVKNDNETIENFIERRKKEDRASGFNFEEPSLMRLKVLELEDDHFVFIWSHHHILMDGWCMSILINDFGNIIDAISSNKSIDQPKPVKYSEYIKWLSKVDKEESLNYWKNYLDGLETIIDIPFKKKQPLKFEVKHFNFDINGELYQRISQLCQEIGITVNTFVQGVWGYLLSRYNNTQDVVFGSVVSGRPGELSGVEEIVGLFINTIPVRLKYTNNDTPKSLLKQLQSEAIKSASHHYMNLSDVQSQSILGVELIKNLMVFENYFVQETAADTSEEYHDKQTINVEEVKTFEQTNYDFTIIVNPSNSELKIDFSYNSEAFEKEAIKNISQHFINIVEQFSKEDDVKLGDVVYLTEDEKHKILVDFNDTESAFPKDKTVIELFEEQVKKAPDNIAVSFEDCILTYRELDNLTDKMAGFLTAHSAIKKGDLAAIKLERSEYLIVSILAVLKIGAAYVPLDVNYPENRINTIVEETKAKVLIDQQIINDFNLNKESLSAVKLNIDRSSDDLAYVIYTSGSTGTPKGVMISNKSLVNLCFWHTKTYEVNAQSRGTLYAGVAFDASVWEIFPYLISGASLYPIQDDETRFQIENLVSFLKTNKITHSYIPSKICQDIIEENVSGLETKLLTGGEALVYSKESNLKIYNNYGPTENTVVATYYDCQSKTDKNVPIGKPISNVQVYILNDKLNMQPVGVIGELCISGESLSNGYLNNEELTNEKFIENPFKSGQKIYKTGDLARWLPDGNIEFMGRIDGQVKIRGYRIELGEIEKQLLSQEGIKHSVVLVKEIKGEKCLVAYYVSDYELDKKILTENLSKMLPDYMIPAYYVQLDVIPLTTNDKVDRKALPDVDDTDLIREEYIAPDTEEEFKLIEVWKRVLDIDKIGVNDNFFALGGNSIKAMMIIGGINKTLGVKINLETFFLNPTVKALALEISNKAWYEYQLSEENISDKVVI